MQSRIVMESKMLNLEITVTEVQVGSRGMAVSVELAKVPHDILRSLLAHGVIQKVGDAASAAKSAAIAAKFGDSPVKADVDKWLETESAKDAISLVALGMMEKAVDALYEGRWAIREGTGTRSRWSDEQALALEMARDTLSGIFKQAAKAKGVKASAESYVKNLGDKVAAYFTEKAGKYVWNDQHVMAYITAQAEAGKVDYMADARTELARRAALVADLNVDDMLGDI